MVKDQIIDIRPWTGPWAQKSEGMPEVFWSKPYIFVVNILQTSNTSITMDKNVKRCPWFGKVVSIQNKQAPLQVTKLRPAFTLTVTST